MDCVDLKDVETDELTFKAKVVAHGHLDVEKHNLFHNSINTRQVSLRLSIALASIMGFGVCTKDISEANLQSPSKLHREVYHIFNTHLHAPAGYILK